MIYRSIKSETIESDSSVNIDKFTKSLYENQKFIDHKAAIPEFLREENEHSVSGRSVDLFESKESESAFVRKESNPRINAKHHKRIMVGFKLYLNS